MFTIEEIKEINEQHRRMAIRARWDRFIQEFRGKANIRLDEPGVLKRLEGDDVNWSTPPFIWYKDIPLKVQILIGYPITFEAKFPEVNVLRKGRWYQEGKFENPITTKAESSLSTDEFYAKIQDAHKRYLSLLKRRARDQETIKATAAAEKKAREAKEAEGIAKI